MRLVFKSYNQVSSVEIVLDMRYVRRSSARGALYCLLFKSLSSPLYDMTGLGRQSPRKSSITILNLDIITCCAMFAGKHSMIDSTQGVAYR